ncbi:S8 family serine peptidase [Peredibacter starrii]|uniref:S8 family serine peptidase n=1 Tax=Peredibacter starrii TaxID=28202 RepID=A0AAX4HQR7_9BACT|nr:S8 family serine peptidase [Peredibacter starrii]WPU65683.1 S8 family serine peptidase [Peredibacter starrii]
MMSKTALLALALPLSITAAFARVQVIPKAEQDIKLFKQNQSQYVLKNAKGTILQTSAKSLLSVRPENWFNLSPAEGAEGVGTEETYRQFGVAQSEDIIVAVIDSGVDVNHEDLQGKIWINKGEIANDGIDNDGNGYVDDVFGWNFIGGSNGMAKMVEDSSLANGIRLVKGNPAAQTDADSLEVTRELVRMKKLKARTEELGETLTPAQQAHLEKIQAIVTENLEAAKGVVATYTTRLNSYKEAEAVLKSVGVTTMTLEAVRAVQSEDEAVVKAKSVMITLLANGQNEARLNRVLEYYGDQIKYYYNEDFNPRSIVGDNYSDMNERIYGNNDVIGPDSSHGTHVSGSIAAVRDNNLGIKGVATNVKIMAVRVVPNGDERDKDVANGIRYAVDNGARVINMSFGKMYSPFKKVVDEAVRYAESKGVLLVHAAGNDNKNNDVTPSFPQRTYSKEGRDFNNWLEIGASSFEKGLTLPADFSNYGKKTVDLFAPGVDILSTTPDNTYDTYSGTSMASPTAAGVATLLLSYDPSMDADAVKALMIDTSRRYPNLKVNLPGTETPVLFSTLSTYGTILDVLSATKSLK